MEQSGGRTGRVIAGRYRLGGVLGRGGMGTVWRAVDEMLHRDVAVKELRLPDHLDDEEREIQRERTLREARTAARVSHENVITIYDVVEDGGIPWIVMELVEAESLAETLTARGTLPPEEAAAVGGKVLAALLAAYDKGVLHRDVKPANILVTTRGRVVLTDFGIATVAGSATLTPTGMLVGSPEYLAPERAEGRRPDLASDLWSLGVVLYMAVEGRNPFARGSMIGTLNSILQDEPDPPRHAGPLAPLIEGWLRKDPAQRTSPADGERMLAEISRGTGSATPAAATAAAVGADATQVSPNAVTAAVPPPLSPPVPTVPPTAGASFGPGQGYAPGPGPRPGGNTPGTPWPTPEYPPSGGYATPSYEGPGTLPTQRESGEEQTRREVPPPRNRTPLVVGVVVLVLVLIGGGVGLALALNNKKSGSGNNASGPTTSPTTSTQQSSTGPTTSATSPPASPSASPSNSAPTTGSAPPTAAPTTLAGYTWTVDPAGFSLFVPNGWTRRTSGSNIDYVNQDQTGLLRISTLPVGDPLTNFEGLDQQFANAGGNDYTQIKLASFDYRAGTTAAEWEFQINTNPVNPATGAKQLTHAIDLGWETDQGHDYAVYAASFLPEWSATYDAFSKAVTYFQGP